MTHARRIAAVTTVLALGALSGCTAVRHPQHTASKPVVLTTSQIATLRSYGAGDTAFGLGLLSSLCASQSSGNVVISPVSIASALGLAYLGARGTTATAMAHTMHLPDVPLASLEAGLRARSELLSSLASKGVTFTQSNRIWADKSLPTERSYIAALASAYRASLAHVPLLSDPAGATKTIDAAVAKETRGHIPELLAPGALDGSIGWVLTNALYLKAAWAQPFEHQQTTTASFNTASGQVQAHYLNGQGYSFATDGGWAAAKLPYKGGRLSMLALLPPTGVRRPATAGHLAGRGCSLPEASQLTTLAARLAKTSQTAAIALPKIKLSWSGSLSNQLKALGMGVAFTPKANFTGISTKACCNGLVQHAATLQVGEKGTVASAATAVGISASAAEPEPTVLRFNRPYLLAIEDARTGEPLMLAWVANPAAS